jgi:hypothetical protein
MQHLIELALCANLEILTGLRALFSGRGVPREKTAHVFAALAEFRRGMLAMREAQARYASRANAALEVLGALQHARESHAEITAVILSELRTVPADLAAQYAATLKDFAIGLEQLTAAAETERAAFATS